MISLFVDTSYKSMYVALIKNNELLAEKHMMTEANFSELLLPSISLLLESTGYSTNQIGKIFVTVGPGSFTGIRIGLTVCKVLAWSLGIGIIPISSLEFMATTKVDADDVIPIIDARRDKVFGGVYDSIGNTVIGDSYTCVSDLVSSLTGTYKFVSYDNFDFDNVIVPSYDVMKVLKKHENDKEVNCHAIKPNYLKKTEAEESRL